MNSLANRRTITGLIGDGENVDPSSRRVGRRQERQKKGYDSDNAVANENQRKKRRVSVTKNGSKRSQNNVSIAGSGQKIGEMTKASTKT